MERQHVATGTKWEPIVGYSRAVRVGQLVFVAGTTATDESGTVVGGTDAYLQAHQALKNIAAALETLGARLTDVVRTRIFVTNIDDWEKVAVAHGEFFGAVRPAATLVAVQRLILPDMLVEIEADAVVA